MESLIAEFLGSGDGAGYGADSGYGSGAGDGAGSGYGYGSGAGSGYGYGYGDAYGDLIHLKSFCGQKVYTIDCLPTLIDKVRGDIAKGKILHEDFSCTPCYVVKQEGYFAHGHTLKEAWGAVLEKVFVNMPLKKRLDAFVEAHDKEKEYPNTDFFEWHGRLTGSCRMGREAFVKNHQIDMQGKMTVSEFIRLTENNYGSEVIRRLKERYDKEDNL